MSASEDDEMRGRGGAKKEEVTPCSSFTPFIFFCVLLLLRYCCGGS